MLSSQHLLAYMRAECADVMQAIDADGDWNDDAKRRSSPRLTPLNRPRLGNNGMAAGKEIRTKISSIQSTQKITSAMEMVAASKMRRAQDRMQLGKPYAQRMRAVVGHIANSTPEYRHAYMQEREVKRAGYIIVSTDRGLCGGLNINLFKAAIQSMKAPAGARCRSRAVLVGAKSAGFFASVGGNVTATVRDLGEEPAVEDLIGGVKTMLDAYTEGRIDALYLAGNEFVNTMTQSPQVEQFCP